MIALKRVEARLHAGALSALIVVASVLVPISARADCGAAPGGPPNSCPGVASTGGTGSPDAGAGNPINVMTGNKYEREVDMPALPGVLGLEIIRHYNSVNSQPGHPNGAMGRGWRLSYETALFDRFGKIQIIQADGGRVIFDRDTNHSGLCSTVNPANGKMTLVPQKNGRSEYVWTWTNGRKLYFDGDGKLYRIKALTGESVSLDYDQRNVLRRVTDPQGRRLDMAYFDPALTNHFRGVQFIDSPVGRFEYQYGSDMPKGAMHVDARNLLALLVKVKLPTSFAPDKPAHALTSRGTTNSTISRLYHHEDPANPWLMTGISIETTGADRKTVATRYSTFGYDSDGHAILSTHANNVGKVTLDASAFGKTVLTNSLGQKTTYLHAIIAGEHRLLEVRGAGCALCGETNVRYGYNAVGQLTEKTKLSASGAPFAASRTDYDKLGRVSRIGKRVFMQGKAQPVQWTARFDYQGDSFAPSVIARPSVVPGKEAITRIAYNAVGQPLSVQDIGWVPTFDGTRSTGQIERTTRYRYSVINKWSLLTEIDGPLPNGPTNTPGDSDITVIEYDGRSNGWVPPTPKSDLHGVARYDPSIERAGLLTRIISPGNFMTDVLERDDALRPAKLRNIDGDHIQVTTVTNNWRSAPLDINVAAGTLRRNIHYEYNAANQIVSVTRPGNLRTTFQYDLAGQLSATILPDGSGMLTTHDSEGGTQRTARLLDAAADITDSLSTTHFDFDQPTDQPRRLARARDLLGIVVSYRYNDVGQVATITNELGISSRFVYRTNGLLSKRTDAAGTPDAASVGMDYDIAGHETSISGSNGVATTRLYDDFGQKVMEADPDHGVILFRYDAVGRMVARIDETMSTTRFTFDHADRLIAAGADEQPNLVQYQYQGRQLITMDSTPDGNLKHATERKVYQRDAFGQVIRETHWLASATAQSSIDTTAMPGVTFITTSSYDAAGRLISQTLPDGHCLRYRYAPADGHSRPSHRPGQLEAILFDDRLVVSDIEQSIAGGLTGFTMGNGIRQQIRLDQRGRIEQLKVLSSDPDKWWNRVKAWCARKKFDTSLLYRQMNRYDDGGRIVQIDRQSASSPGNDTRMRSERYEYDAMNRLLAIIGSDGRGTTFEYDKNGNRIAEVSTSSRRGLMRTTAVEPVSAVSSFHYAEGSNRLVTITQDAGSAGTAQNRTPDAGQAPRSAWYYHPTGVPLAQLQWMKSGGAAIRRIVYNSAKRPIAVYENDSLIVRYRYNHRGERVAKTVYRAVTDLKNVGNNQATDRGNTTYSLYRDQRLAAETDDSGRITAHYIYLYGKPVAKIATVQDRSIFNQLWKAIALHTLSDGSDSVASIFAIVTDHLGTPQLVTDDDQQITWQGETTAFGQTRVTYAATVVRSAKPFSMNLRLPGQVFDDETRLNYNYLRDYDPENGRYITPDPTGLGGGSNPYAYVSNNPLSNIDTLGLYEEDIHYYMTYFLAMAAGIDPRRAYIIATATQYVDDNPITQPMAPTLIGSAWQITAQNSEQQKRLASYHFTERVADDWSQNVLDRYMMTKKPENAQLQLLQSAATYARTSGGSCAGDVLFGEYLHAFEDSFGHRDADNVPIQVNSGWGHATSGHAPDHTYNEDFSYMWEGRLIGDNWKYNEDRTLEMEKEVFEKLKKLADGKQIVQSWSTIQDTLQRFNRIHEDSATTNGFTKYPSKKLDILNTRLSEFGYEFGGTETSGELDLYRLGAGLYNAALGKSNRDNLLRYNNSDNNHKVGDKFKNNDPKLNGIILP